MTAGISRRLLGQTFGTLLAGAAARAWSQSPAATEDVWPKEKYLKLVDPELRDVARALTTVTVSADTLEKARAGRATRPSLPQPYPQPVRKSIPGPKGGPAVVVAFIDGTGGKKDRPAYLHMHGGGFVLGSAFANVPALQETAQELEGLVISVEYRRSPETPFPGALEDNYAALRWIHANAAELGVDPRRIAIGGESAGGGHAAMLAIAARDRKEMPVCFQLLIYPMLDDRTGSTHIPAPHLGQLVANAATDRYDWGAFLGKSAGSPEVPYGSVPARIDDLSGLPPAFIGVGGLDLFLEEDIEYARRLLLAKVPTELLVIPGAFHAFDLLAPKAAVSRQFLAAGLNALKRGVGLQS